MAEYKMKKLIRPESKVFSDMVYVDQVIRAPKDDEILCSVKNVGLNFRDVLNVLGMYPGDAGELGGDFSGTVIQVGKNCRRLKVGDEVIGMAAVDAGSFATLTLCREDEAVLKPKNAGWDMAAALPIFATPYYGFFNLANMKKGDKVLIHAAAGGVGLSAVQICQMIGCEIFATAGSPAKHQLLRDMGVKHIMSSRVPDFAPKIMELTNNQGVDIVLNSLLGDYISHSLKILKNGGTFLEIGKREIWTREMVDKVNPGARYFAFEMTDIPVRIGTILARICEDYEKNGLKPVPFTHFEAGRTVEAFRHMAAAKHVGKIVVGVPEVPLPVIAGPIEKSVAGNVDNAMSMLQRLSSMSDQEARMALIRKHQRAQ